MLTPAGVMAGMPTTGKPAAVNALPPGLADTPVGTRLSGTVVGRNDAGHLLVRTAAGMAAIVTTLKPARGTIVTLRIRGGEQPHLSIVSVAGDAEIAGLRRTGLSFALSSELNEALMVFQKTNPGLAAAVVQHGMATPGDGLASAVLSFLAALKRGDFPAWFGDEAGRALERVGKSDLLARLQNNFGQQARLLDQAASSDWQTLFVPLHDGESVRQLRFYYRRGQDREPGGEDKQDSRFVVEIETSRLGGMQLDGLVGKGRFDLVLRSRQDLPVSARRDITQIFSDGLAITGQIGGIVFQTVDSFPILPMDSPWRAASEGLLV